MAKGGRPSFGEVKVSNGKMWCILRCKSANTLPLLKSLGREGIEVWSPVERVTKRVPRANIRRVIDHALLPSYIFAAASDLPALIALCEAPASEHRDFRVFHHHGRLPLIADATLAPLRLLEERLALSELKRRSRGQMPRLNRGDEVKLTEGGFAGLAGVIELVGKQFTSVRFKGFSLPLKIANFYLLPSEAENGIQCAA